MITRRVRGHVMRNLIFRSAFSSHLVFQNVFVVFSGAAFIPSIVLSLTSSPRVLIELPGCMFGMCVV